jgi:hypothetical protein
MLQRLQFMRTLRCLRPNLLQSGPKLLLLLF